MRRLGILCILFMLGGCSSAVISLPVDNNTIVEGVVYTIPKQLVKFSLTREAITQKSLEKKLATATENVASAKTAADKQDGIVADCKTKFEDPSVTDPNTKKTLKLKFDLAQIDHKVLTEYHTKTVAKKKFAKTKLDAFKNNYFEDSMKLTPLKPVPDPSNRFVVEIKNGIFSSETIEIKTTPEGLLSGGTAKSEGQLDEIFVALVKSIATFSGSSFRGVEKSYSAESSFGTVECPMEEVKFTHIFDLKTDPTLTKLNQKLIANQLCYRLELVSGNPTDAPTDLKKLKKQPSALTGDPCPTKPKYESHLGLLYPRKSAVQFDLHKIDTSAKDVNDATVVKTFAQSFFPIIIDTRSLGVLSLDKALFADNEYEFEFKDGLLTRYKSVTPNEFISFLSMFPEAAKAIVQIPAEILQLKVDYSSTEEGYYKGQQAALAARLAYEQALTDQLNSDTDD